MQAHSIEDVTPYAGPLHRGRYSIENAALWADPLHGSYFMGRASLFAETNQAELVLVHWALRFQISVPGEFDVRDCHTR